MMLKWVIIGVVAVVATLVVGAVVWSGDESGKPGHGEGMHMAKQACMTELTPEQRETLKATMEELKEADASKEEIHQAIAGLFTEWGIERPHKASDSGKHGGMFWKQLTPEQRDELYAELGSGLGQIYDAEREAIAALDAAIA